jgi:prepilin-type N-terminal cleavage/methylation domain-containing protein
MSRISVLDSGRRRAFTLVEVMVATSLLAVILAGVLAAYLFVGRNLTRLVNLQEQEVASRRTLRYFTQDVSAAISLTTATATQLSLTKQSSGGSAAVSYVYSSGAGTLVRTEGGVSLTLLSGITALAFTYFNQGGTAISSSTQSMKAVELSVSSAVGSANSGTLAKYTTVSPRVVLRNKPALQ